MSSFYQSDLARVHDQDFSSLARDAAYLIKKMATSDQKTVLDLGSGSGTLAGLLAAYGFDVTGVDYSPDMVELAQKKVPEASFIRSSIFDYEPPPCDIISMIGEVICYLFDHKSDEQHLGTLFQKLYSTLNPDGLLIFDFLTPDVATEGHLARRIIERANWSMFVTLDKDASGEILTRDITLFYKVEELYRRSQEIHRQRLYKKATLQGILEDIGFQIELLDSYGDEPFRTGHVGIVARK
ncbi:MAG: class I SAM-dependent methyltransferase [Saprospiraceae bacterium]|nr:class I SAM-dependent methyltransferase [Saprospiraceae bacterium]